MDSTSTALRVGPVNAWPRPKRLATQEHTASCSRFPHIRRHAAAIRKLARAAGVGSWYRAPPARPAGGHRQDHHCQSGRGAASGLIADWARANAPRGSACRLPAVNKVRVTIGSGVSLGAVLSQVDDGSAPGRPPAQPLPPQRADDAAWGRHRSAAAYQPRRASKACISQPRRLWRFAQRRAPRRARRKPARGQLQAIAAEPLRSACACCSVRLHRR